MFVAIVPVSVQKAPYTIFSMHSGTLGHGRTVTESNFNFFSDVYSLTLGLMSCIYFLIIVFGQASTSDSILCVGRMAADNF